LRDEASRSGHGVRRAYLITASQHAFTDALCSSVGIALPVKEQRHHGGLGFEDEHRA
jgi:hypothetical protein